MGKHASHRRVCKHYPKSIYRCILILLDNYKRTTRVNVRITTFVVSWKLVV